MTLVSVPTGHCCTDIKGRAVLGLTIGHHGAYGLVRLRPRSWS
jgi:hypothetical protein